MISLNGNYFSLKHTTTNQCWHISYVIFAMIVVSIISIASISCSADDDYGYVSYAEQELSTRADGMMKGGREIGPILPFPTVDEILANQAVRDTLLMIWEETKSLAGPTQRRELGAFIRYDRTSGHYFFGRINYGDTVGCSRRARIVVTPDYWEDRCAFFHTHATLQYCSGVERTIIPTEEDTSLVNTLGIPGIVYDYIIDVLKGGMSKDMAWKAMKYGPDRRTN